MKKQTAVEWLYEILTTENWEYKTYEEQNEIFQKAKQREKEQIINSFKHAQVLKVLKVIKDETRAEQYYNQTFKSE